MRNVKANYAIKKIYVFILSRAQSKTTGCPNGVKLITFGKRVGRERHCYGIRCSQYRQLFQLTLSDQSLTLKDIFKEAATSSI